MRRFLLIMCILISCILFVPTTSAQTAQPWEVEVSPPFAFITQNITVTVWGEPNVYLTLRLYNSTGVVIHNAFIPTDAAGKSSYNYTIPLEAASGHYLAEAMFEGIVVAIRPFEVIFDENLYYKVKIAEMEDRISQQDEIIKDQRRRIVVLSEQASNAEYWSYVAMGVAFLVVVIVLYAFKEWLAWVVANMREESRMGDWLVALVPRQKGYLGTMISTVDGQLSSYQTKLRKKLEGRGVESDSFPQLRWLDRKGNVQSRKVTLVNPDEVSLGSEEFNEKLKEAIAEHRPGRRLEKYRDKREGKRQKRIERKKEKIKERERRRGVTTEVSNEGPKEVRDVPKERPAVTNGEGGKNVSQPKTTGKKKKVKRRRVPRKKEGAK